MYRSSYHQYRLLQRAEQCIYSICFLLYSCSFCVSRSCVVVVVLFLLLNDVLVLHLRHLRVVFFMCFFIFPSFNSFSFMSTYSSSSCFSSFFYLSLMPFCQSVKCSIASHVSARYDLCPKTPKWCPFTQMERLEARCLKQDFFIQELFSSMCHCPERLPK